MTSSVTRSAVVGMATIGASLGDRAGALLDLASGWLNAEAASVMQPGRVELVTIAAERASAYEEALAAATPEAVRLAWEQAVVRQAQSEVGSVPWATAFRVSELLRFEDKAARDSQAVTGHERRLVAEDVRDFPT